MADTDSDSESEHIEVIKFRGEDENPVQNTIKEDVQATAENIKTYNVEADKFFIPAVINGQRTEQKADPDDLTIQVQISQIKLNEALYCKQELQNIKDKKQFNATQLSVQNHAIPFKQCIWKMLADIPNVSQPDIPVSKLANARLNNRVPKKLKSKNNVNNQNDEKESFKIEYAPFWEALDAKDIQPIQHVLVDYISKACNEQIANSAQSIICAKTSKPRSSLKTTYILPFDRLCHEAVCDAVAELTKDKEFCKLDSAFSVARSTTIKAIKNKFNSKSWSKDPRAPWDDTQTKKPVLTISEMKQLEPEQMISPSWQRFTNEQYFRIVINELEWVQQNLEEMREREINSEIIDLE